MIRIATPPGSHQMKPPLIHRSFFVVASMLVPVLIAQDDPTKKSAGGAADAKVKAKAKGKAAGPQAKAFQRIVQELDSNGDEVLQRSEVPDSAREQFDALLELMDADGDKALSRGELQAAGARVQAVLGAGGPNAAGKAAAKKPETPKKPEAAKKDFAMNPLERLQMMDADGDGKISREEWRGAPPLFERIDRDADGFITENEQEFAVQAMRRFMEAAKKKGEFPKKKPEN